jgi:3-oxoacyl-[acyl-carrier-protein] synthase-3
VNLLHTAGITSVGTCVPPRVMTNFDFEKIVDTSDEWIRTRSGISRRHFADADTTTSDLAIGAARQALERGGLAPEALDLIIVATFTPDQPLPGVACQVQHALGASNAAAFDVSAACTGFIYAITMGQSTIATGLYRNVLVIGAETMSKFLDFTDRGTCVLLGDGAGAVLLQPAEEGHGFLSAYLRADGSGYDLLTLPGGGSRHPATHATVDAGLHRIHMSGNEVFKFAVRAMEEALVTALDKAGLTTADVNWVVPHQANIRIIDAAAKRLGIAEECWVTNIAEYGNTSAASIPLALNEIYTDGRLKKGDIVAMVGFGGGLTWGATVVRW